MPKTQRNLVKTTFRVPHDEWIAFKEIADDEGTCPADFLRKLVHGAVKEARRKTSELENRGLLSKEQMDDLFQMAEDKGRDLHAYFQKVYDKCMATD
jgi:hypothetical protein